MRFELIDDSRINAFADWLGSRGCSASTIAKYVHYLDLVVMGFGQTLDNLVLSEDSFQRAMSEFDHKIDGAESSRESYKTAFRKYHEFSKDELTSVRRSSLNIVPLTDGGKYWFREYTIGSLSALKDVLSWLGLVGLEGEVEHQWVFRGQGFSSWGLETSLGRCAYKGDVYQRRGTALKQYENDSMWEFAREASKDPEFRSYTGLNLLALMQHYGCKTRLLDFSLSPLVALSMAIDQNADDTGKARAFNSAIHKLRGEEALLEGVQDIPLALWAVDLNVLNPNSCSWKQFARMSFRNGNTIVERIRNLNGLGVSLVFPDLCNPRISAQNGLFLMPNDLNGNFEENLRAALSMNSGDYYANENFSSVDKVRDNGALGVVKFVISPILIPEIKSILMDANITAKSIYPDLIGLGKYVSSMIRI